MMRTEMTTSEKVRDALWRYAPERTERIATVAVVTGLAVAGIANWLRKGRHA
jgi:hypothetical protein